MNSNPSSSTNAPHNPNPTTPVLSDDIEWFTAYAVIHRLSETSWRYAYLFWIIIALVMLVYAAFHAIGLRTGVVGAYWSKWALRRRTWRKKHSLAVAKRTGQPHKQPIPFPSNAQILCLFSLVVISFALSFAGPDYISPGNKLWEFKREVDPTTFFPYQPQFNIGKAWWTSGGRAGLIAFALFPLCVLLVLKAPPFAIFAISFFTNIHFDKLMWLHRWCGRLIWLISAIHTVFWSVQLMNDKRVGTGKMAYVYAWKYPNFIYAWTAFGLLTMIIILSLRPFRDRFYESFYFVHILLVPLMLVMSALHHPPVQWWCWAALMLWGAERIWRLTRWLYTNGFVGSRPSPAKAQKRMGDKQAWEMAVAKSPDIEGASPSIHQALYSSAHLPSRSPVDVPSPAKSLYHTSFPSGSSERFLQPLPSGSSYVPPTGYAHAELLAGRTIRLRFAPPGYITWAPGQHFLLCVPSVSKFVSHPFTCASICDEQAMGDEGRTIVLLIRAKAGWTKDLWESIVTLIASGRKHPRHEVPSGTTLPAMGVLLRCWVDGPFGSSARAQWGEYSSVLIVSGGSGVSFGMSVLEYLCMCMSGRNGKYLGGNVGWGRSKFLTQRIRFIWIIREFAHIQWCASVLRRCTSLVPSEFLQVEFFVTNFKIAPNSPFPQSAMTPISAVSDDLFPPHPRFAKEDRPRTKTGTGSDSEDDPEEPEADEYVDLSYYTGEFGRGELGHEDHVLDLTNFDGDNDERMPGEAFVDRAVKKEGTHRRAFTRNSRYSKALLEAGGHSSQPTSSVLGPERTPPRISAAPPGHRHKLSNLSDVASLSPSTAGPSSPRNSRIVSQSSSHLGDPFAVSAPSHLDPIDTSVSSPASARPALTLSRGWDTRSVMSQASSVQALMPGVGRGAYGEEVKLEVDEREMHDMSVLAEFARSGRPKLDVILRDEVAKANGAVMVACCGPTTLNAVVRKAIAAQIDPGRIRRGDMSGSIALVAEEFSY